jgi:hypothetical protein
MWSTQADNNSRKLRLLCGFQFPWSALSRIVPNSPSDKQMICKLNFPCYILSKSNTAFLARLHKPQLQLNISVVWNRTSYSPTKVNRRFGGTYGFHLRDLRVNQDRNQHEAGSKWRSTCIKTGTSTDPCCLDNWALSGLLTKLWHTADTFVSYAFWAWKTWFRF